MASVGIWERRKEGERREGAKEEGKEGWEDRDPRVGTLGGEVLLSDRSSNWSVCTFRLSRRNLKVLQGILKASGGGLWARLLLPSVGTDFFVVLFFVITSSRFFLLSCSVGLLRCRCVLASCLIFTSYYVIHFSYFFILHRFLIYFKRWMCDNWTSWNTFW